MRILRTILPVAACLSALVLAGCPQTTTPPGGDDHGDTAATATPLAIGDMVAGLLATGDIDVFRFEAAARTSYEVNVGFYNALVTVLDSEQALALGTQNKVAPTAIFHAEAAGSYYVLVQPSSALSETRFYTISLAVIGVDDHGDTQQSATVLQPGVDESGTFIPYDTDVFKVTAPVGNPVVFASNARLQYRLCASSSEFGTDCNPLTVRPGFAVVPLQRDLVRADSYISLASTNVISGDLFSYHIRAYTPTPILENKSAPDDADQAQTIRPNLDYVMGELEVDDTDLYVMDLDANIAYQVTAASDDRINMEGFLEDDDALGFVMEGQLFNASLVYKVYSPTSLYVRVTQSRNRNTVPYDLFAVELPDDPSAP